MKTIKISTLIILVAFLASCKKGGVFCHKGDNNITTEVRDVSNFSKIALSDVGNVYVEQADEYSVSVETSSNLQDIILTEVSGNTLEIKIKKRKCIKGSPTINVYVTAPNINALTISGAGSIYASELIQTTSMDLTISGSGDIQVDSLETSAIDAVISGSGSITANGIGTASNQKVSISGSGSVNTLNLMANNADVHISGSGTCSLHAIQTLDATISGSGDIIYKGTPAITTNISGSGNIRPY